MDGSWMVLERASDFRTLAKNEGGKQDHAPRE